MSIDPISYNKIPLIRKTVARGKKTKTSEKKSSVELEECEPSLAQSMLHEFERVSVVRQSVVELGRKLAQCPDYPNAEQQQRLAKALLSPIEQLIQDEMP